MKSKINFLHFRFILFPLLILICCGSISPLDEVLYYNPFEGESDLQGWYGLSATNLNDDTPTVGGEHSVYISGGCVMPTSEFILPATNENQIIIIECFGKNLGLGGNVTLYAGGNYANEFVMAILDTNWKHYRSDDKFFWPAYNTLSICLNSGGFVASAMLIDELKIVSVD